MSTTRELLRATWERDRLIVPVPWNRAEALQTYLRDNNISSTLCLEPLVREAYLEVRAEGGANTVQSVLDRWEG
jgi:hypothetical protein